MRSQVFKRRRTSAPTALSRQRGAVLLVSLVVLLMLTMMGLASIDSSGMQMQMANNNGERLVAMQAAEAGLKEAEDFLENVGFDEDDLIGFNEACTLGLCVDLSILDMLGGTLNIPLGGIPCLVESGLESLGLDPLLDVWDDNSGKHFVMQRGAVPATVKYIYEFLCSDGSSETYRITALAVTDSGRGRVMLQSTYVK